MFARLGFKCVQFKCRVTINQTERLAVSITSAHHCTFDSCLQETTMHIVYYGYQAVYTENASIFGLNIIFRLLVLPL